jgi:hypothetical protein
MSEIDITDIFNNGARVIRMTSDDPPKASCVDFVMAVTGQDSNNSNRLMKRLQEDDTPYWSNLKKHQFSGPGQKPNYVLSASEAIELLMVLPGKVAKQFRRECAKLITRVFGGDDSVKQLLHENAMSDAPLQTWCRQEVMSTNGVVMGDYNGVIKDAEELALEKEVRMSALKRLKMDQDCAMDEVSLTHRFKAFKDIHSFVQPILSDGRTDHTSRAFLDNRIRNAHLTMFENEFNRITTSGQALALVENTERVFIADVITQMQIVDDNGSLAKRAGRIAAEMYREKYTGEEPDRDERIVTVVGGENRIEKFFYYSMEDIPLLKEAVHKAVAQQEAFLDRARIKEDAKRKREQTADCRNTGTNKQAAFMNRYVQPRD